MRSGVIGEPNFSADLARMIPAELFMRIPAREDMFNPFKFNIALVVLRGTTLPLNNREIRFRVDQDEPTILESYSAMTRWITGAASS